jgi:hypothetical protein
MRHTIQFRRLPCDRRGHQRRSMRPMWACTPTFPHYLDRMCHLR